jgi:hypothetical protein
MPWPVLRWLTFSSRLLVYYDSRRGEGCSASSRFNHIAEASTKDIAIRQPRNHRESVKQNSTRRSFLKTSAAAAGALAFALGTWSCRETSPGSTEASLTEKELDEISAFASRIFGPEDKKELAELDRTIRWWAAGRTNRGPHLALYRDGLAALAASDANDKRLIAFREEILEGIYSTSVGWKSLGYTTWPGVPSSPLEYTTKPHGPGRVVLSTPLAELVG